MDNSNTDGVRGVYTIDPDPLLYGLDGTNDLVRVWDSGSKFEMITEEVMPRLLLKISVDLVSRTAVVTVTISSFNSDRAPPSFERRSDNKGPEPESVTVATLDDGTRLVFTGLERTGGIVTYDITDPTAPVYQDFLNVRN